jgi:hypothetical protein
MPAARASCKAADRKCLADRSSSKTQAWCASLVFRSSSRKLSAILTSHAVLLCSAVEAQPNQVPTADDKAFRDLAASNQQLRQKVSRLSHELSILSQDQNVLLRPAAGKALSSAEAAHIPPAPGAIPVVVLEQCWQCRVLLTHLCCSWHQVTSKACKKCS